MRRLSTIATTVAAGLLVAAPLRAQGERFPRPKLDQRADTNDWGAYFDRGVLLLNARSGARAEAAFYWASRLDPERAEPYHGRWVAFHLRDQKRWTGYLAGRERVLADPDVVAMDSVRLHAMMRNPFVHRGLELILFDEMPGRFREDFHTLGWLAYAQPDFPRAVRFFGKAIDKDPARYLHLRAIRAQSFVAMRQLDSALAELLTLQGILEAREATQTLVAYESKEFLHFALGILHSAQRRPDLARRSMERALGENLGFFPAHLGLGDMALNAGDGEGALAQYDAALAIVPADPVLHYRRGLALQRLGRWSDAAAAFRASSAVEPFYAPPRLELGRVLERAGDHAGARLAYEGYLLLAPRTAGQGIAHARSRVVALASAP
jgi:tetratricopeptide (TPR) repeat protein